MVCQSCQERRVRLLQSAADLVPGVRVLMAAITSNRQSSAARVKALKLRRTAKSDEGRVEAGSGVDGRSGLEEG